MTSTNTLRELIEWALAAGADRQLVREASDEVVALAGQVFSLQREADPRKKRTSALARRVYRADQALKRNGTTTGRASLLAQQFGRSVSRIHALLAMSCELQDG